MLAGITGFGQTKTITINNASIGGQSVLGSGAYNNGAERVWTTSDISFGGKAITGNANNTPQGQAAQTVIQAQANNGIIYNTTSIPGKIVSIKINSVGTASGFNLFGGSSGRLVNATAGSYTVNGGTAVGSTSTTGWTSTDFGTKNYTYFAIKKASGTGYISSIVIEYQDVPVCTVPVIVDQPTDVTVKVGETTTFTVNATGDNLTYNWQVFITENNDWYTLEGEEYKTNSLSLSNTPLSENGTKFRVVVKSGECEVISNEVIVNVVECYEPVIVDQPTDLTIKAGETTTFTVNATGDNLTYQWQGYHELAGNEWIDLEGEEFKTNSFSVSNTPLELNGAKFRVIISSGTCQTISNEVTLTVECTAPVIVDQPTNVTVKEGESATFTVDATGYSLTYKWQSYENDKWNDISYGSDTNTFNIPVAALEMNGIKLRVVVSSATCQTISNEVTITVEPKLAVNDVNANKVNLVKNTLVTNEIIFGHTTFVSIYNMNGQVVKSARVTEGTKLNVATLVNGTYIVAGEVNGKMVSQKVIKK